jgi:hypothetical protein
MIIESGGAAAIGVFLGIVIAAPSADGPEQFASIHGREEDIDEAGID